ENLEFRDALKLLANKAGVQLPEYSPRNKQQEDEREKLVKINNFAARLYHEILLKDRRGKKALDYIVKRGLHTETITQWQIGYAPDEYHALEEALSKKKIYNNDLVTAGVSSKSDKGQIFD